MDLVAQLIAEIRLGSSAEDLKRIHAGDEISSADLSTLLDAFITLTPQETMPLLTYLYPLVQQNDFDLEIRLLTQGILHPLLTHKKKRKLLNQLYELRKRMINAYLPPFWRKTDWLLELWETFPWLKYPPVLMRLDADLAFLHGTLADEQGQLQEASTHWRRAYSLYRGLKDQEWAQALKERLKVVQFALRRKTAYMPFETLHWRRVDLENAVRLQEAEQKAAQERLDILRLRWEEENNTLQAGFNTQKQALEAEMAAFLSGWTQRKNAMEDDLKSRIGVHEEQASGRRSVLESEILYLSGESDRLTEEIDRMRTEIEKLNTEIDEKNRHIDQVRDEAEYLEKRLESRQSTYETIQQSIHSLMEQYQDQTRRVEGLREEIKNLRAGQEKQIEEHLKTIKTLQKQADQFRTRADKQRDVVLTLEKMEREIRARVEKTDNGENPPPPAS